MGGIPHDHYKPKPGFQTWMHKRLPIFGLMYDTLMIPTPKNLNWMDLGCCVNILPRFTNYYRNCSGNALYTTY